MRHAIGSTDGVIAGPTSGAMQAPPHPQSYLVA